MTISSSKGGQSGTELKIELHQPPDNEKYRLPYFYPGSLVFLRRDSISGTLVVPLFGGRGFRHEGISISIIGQNRIKSDNSLTQFFKVTKVILEKGEIKEEKIINFELGAAPFPVPSFYGNFADCRYLVQANVKTQSAEYSQTIPIYVLFTNPPPEKVEPLRVEIGIQNVLHIEFVIQNPIFDCSSMILGKLNFQVVKIRIVNVFIQVKRTELFDNGIIRFKHESIVAQNELLDGTPVRGERVPIRFFMSNIKAWPYPNKIVKNLAVEYSIRFLLVDENGKHYFKDISQKVMRLAI